MAKKKAAKKGVKKAAKKTAKKSAKKRAAKKGGKKKAAKKSTKKKSASSAGRELIAPRGDKRYVRRDDQGQFSESDDVSRSLSQDRKRKAARTVKAGQGDKGDRRSR
ncbi:MAG TPA: hypothetical protein VF175_08085 [Lacipirellula sp.]